MLASKCYSLLLAAVVCIYPPTIGADLFEDFSDGAINAAKFRDSGGGVELDTLAEELIIRSSAISFLPGVSRNFIRLQDSDVSLMQADLKITDYVQGNPETRVIYAGVSGTYYNSQSATPSTEAGEIFVRIALADRGQGLEVLYSIFEGDAQGDYSIVHFGELDVPNLSLDTYYTASIAYDGDNTFDFTFNGVSSGAIDGPVRMGNALYEMRRVDAGIGFGEVNSTADPEDTGVDDGSVGSIEARYDNVTDQSGLVDDFSGDELSDVVWQDGLYSREVESESLVLVAVGDGSTIRTSFRVGRTHTDYLGATVTLIGSSTMNSTTRVQARLAGYWYNDTYDESDAGNGEEGNIWAALQIERVSGAMRATVNMWREDPDHPDGGTDVHWEQIAGVFDMDTAYELAIERSADSLLFYVDGVVMVDFPIVGNNFPSRGSEYKILRAEIREDEGEAHARFDDVFTDYVAPMLTLNATNSDQQEVELPPATNVREGEEVTLTADAENEATVVAYVWEQTAGTDVDILPVPRPGLAGRIVGSDQSLRFEVPTGSDGTTLEFRVTVVDESGTHVSQGFALGVDNSRQSTLSVSSDAGDDDDNDDSGSAMSPWLAAIFLLALWTRRRRPGRLAHRGRCR